MKKFLILFLLAPISFFGADIKSSKLIQVGYVNLEEIISYHPTYQKLVDEMTTQKEEFNNDLNIKNEEILKMREELSNLEAKYNMRQERETNNSSIDTDEFGEFNNPPHNMNNKTTLEDLAKEIDSLQRSIASKIAEFQKLQVEYADKLQKIQEKKLDPIQKEISKIIQKVSYREGVSILYQIPSADIVYIDPSLDITDTIVTEMKKTLGTGN